MNAEEFQSLVLTALTFDSPVVLGRLFSVSGRTVRRWAERRSLPGPATRSFVTLGLLQHMRTMNEQLAVIAKNYEAARQAEEVELERALSAPDDLTNEEAELRYYDAKSWRARFAQEYMERRRTTDGK